MYLSRHAALIPLIERRCLSPGIRCSLGLLCFSNIYRGHRSGSLEICLVSILGKVLSIAIIFRHPVQICYTSSYCIGVYRKASSGCTSSSRIVSILSNNSTPSFAEVTETFALVELPIRYSIMISSGSFPVGGGLGGWRFFPHQSKINQKVPGSDLFVVFQPLYVRLECCVQKPSCIVLVVLWTGDTRVSASCACQARFPSCKTSVCLPLNRCYFGQTRTGIKM